MTTRTPLWQLSAAQLRQGYQSQAFSPVQALQSCLQRIAGVQPQINAFTNLRAAAARQEAEHSAQRWRTGQPRSAIDGIPISVKDNLLTKDLPTTWGSKGLADWHSPHDECVVARLRDAGALIVGKTNVPEFTLEGYTDNPVFGASRNPWDLRLTPGGSSGGAAASLAAGCTPLALGTDGGGSIRRPAAHCGLVGFKPSIGTIARTHTLPSLLLDFEVIGLMGRTSGDVADLLQVCQAPVAADRQSLAAHAASAHYPATRADAPLRILYVAQLDGAPVDAEIAASCQAAMQVLQTLGHEVMAAELPWPLQDLQAAWPQIAQMGLSQLFRQQPDWAQAASEKYRQMAELGDALSASRLWQIGAQVQALRQQLPAVFAQWDVIATPCTAALPWPAEQAFPPVINGTPVGPRGHAVFTGWVNAAGLPAVALPTRPSQTGLPIGMQLIGAYGADRLLVQLASHYERLAPWTRLAPLA